MHIDKEILNEKLHRGIWNHDAQFVREMIQSGADVNAENVYGLPALHSSLTEYINYNTDLDVFQTLLKHGADPNKYSNSHSYGKTPLYWILKRDNPYCEISSQSVFNVTQILIKFGANVNKSILNDRGFFPIIFALFYNNTVDVIRLLIKSGADVNTRLVDEKTPLFLVIYKGYGSDIFRLLIDSGAEVNVQDNLGLTPLHEAALSYNLNMFRLLLDVGANPMIQDNNGETPFDIVKRIKHTDIGAAMYMKLMMYS